MKRPTKLSTEPPGIVDEPGMEERFQRALRKALNTPPKHRSAPTPKSKEQTGVKGARSQGEDAQLTPASSQLPFVFSASCSDRLPLHVPNCVGTAAAERLYVILAVAGAGAGREPRRWARMLALEFPRHFTGPILSC